MDVGYEANDSGSKHSSGVFYLVLYYTVKLDLSFLHVILLKETQWLHPKLPNANRNKQVFRWRLSL